MSNTYTFTGQVVHIGPVQEFGSNGFYKRTLVISDEADKYPQEIPFDCAKKSADDAGNLELGQQVTVSFDLRGRHWKDDKWFPSLNAWKIDTLGRKPAPRAADPAQGDLPPLDSEDDLDDSEVPF